MHFAYVRFPHVETAAIIVCSVVVAPGGIRPIQNKPPQTLTAAHCKGGGGNAHIHDHFPFLPLPTGFSKNVMPVHSAEISSLILRVFGSVANKKGNPQGTIVILELCTVCSIMLTKRPVIGAKTLYLFPGGRCVGTERHVTKLQAVKEYILRILAVERS